MNRLAPHILVIPEDHADEQLANAFFGHYAINVPRIDIMRPCGGWRKVLDTFLTEYVNYLRKYPLGHVVMVIDFDGQYPQRRAEFESTIPTDLRDRTFVIGPRSEPEDLKRAMHRHYDEIGRLLAEECLTGVGPMWGHEELKHNQADLQRLIGTVRPILFP